MDAVLNEFASERLLTVGAGTVEISHEVLLTAWPLLRDTWLAETHADRIVRTKLAAATADWDRQYRDSSYLYAGSVLQAATDMAGRISADPARHGGLTTAEQDFLHASHRARHRTARLRRSAVAVLAALAVGLATATGLVARADQRATYQRDVAIAEGLITKSHDIGDSDPVLARLLAVTAWRLSPSPLVTRQAQFAMLDAAALPAIRSIGSSPGGALTVAFSPDGKLLATGDSDGRVRLRNVATGQRVGDPLTGSSSGGVSSVAFSPDGKLLASGGTDGLVRLWDVATSRLAATPIAAGGGSVHSVAFSPDGKTLASADNDGTVRMWEVATGHEVGAPLTNATDPALLVASPALSVAFSPDGNTLASGDDNGAVRLWHVAADGTARPRHMTTIYPLNITLGFSNPVQSVAFSPNGKILASGGYDDGIIRL